MAARNDTARHGTDAQKGFTLIEVIAVLVILGILAAVAIPKYQELQDEAAKKATTGALASGLSRLTWTHAKLVMQGKALITVSDVVTEANLDANCGVFSDKYSVACSSSGLVTATGPQGHFSTATWTLP